MASGNSSSQVQIATTTPQKDRQRRISGETACSSNSSCVLQKRTKLHPLAAGIGCRPQVTRSGPSSINATRSSSTVKQRVLSAKYLRFKTLQNELNDANFHIAQLVQENKILKNLQKRQDHALSRYEGTNAEIPKMIESHQEEVRVLQLKIKGLRKTVKELNEHIKAKDDELNTIKDQNKHLLNLCKSKNLEERDKLSKKVEELEALIRQQDTTISTLNRKISVEAKNSKFKLAAEVSRSRNLQKELSLAKAQIEELTSNANEDKNSTATDRRLSRTTSNDRNKKLTKKLSASTDRLKKSSNENHSTSSLALSEENCETNNEVKNDLTKSETSSSEDQLKNIVESWQKKNGKEQDSLSVNISEYCVDVITEAQQCSVAVNQHTADFKKSEKELETLLESLKETDEINSKFKRVQISSPVLDFTDMFVKKKKDKNANLITKNITKIGLDDDKLDMRYENKNLKSELEVPNGDSDCSNSKISPRRRKLESYRSSTSDLDLETNFYEHQMMKSSKISYQTTNLEDNLEAIPYELYDPINSNYDDHEKANFEKPSSSKLRESNGDLDSTDSSCVDLELMGKSINQFSEKIKSVEKTANEDKLRLLAKLKAIDNGENVSFDKDSNKEKISKKDKNDLLKELFG